MVQYLNEFFCRIDAIMKAAIHTHTAKQVVDVSGITSQQDPALPVGLRNQCIVYK